MKIAIVYYSKSGNTRYIAQLLADRMREEKADVDLIETEVVKDRQDQLAIKNTNVDLGKYDFIVAGSPIWYGKPAPFIKIFVAKAQNIRGKKSAFFTTGATKPDTQSKALKLFRNDLEISGLRTIDCSLALKMKKGEILLGEQNIDSFVKAILSN